MKKLLLLILFICTNSFGQTATIKLKNQIFSENETKNSLKFNFNGQAFGEKDTIIQIKINTSGFDSCKVIYKNYGFDFITKFKENETYEIKQGCCCADFTLEAEKNAERGTVTFKNKTKRDLCLIAGYESDTVATGKKKVIFAGESAMCYFKPCDIHITETEYFSEKYDYNKDTDYKTLSKEQDTFILASTWFHFLHGEKIEVFYNPVLKKMDLKLKGYLSKKEYSKIMESFN
ncbi:hypothetical protein AR687_05260 [Flavobacteriaceae bacterium CRH]|nr:hypothetical protein AR687_05260 [Flavobacteriaceae bacterium CRH]